MPVPKSSVLLASFAVGTLMLVACGDTGPTPATALPDEVGSVDADPTVDVGDNWFAPEELVVEIGTEVTWVWEGRSVHDVVGDGFESDVIAEGSFTHTFEAEGAYPYVCTLHPGMEGTVYVVPEER